MTKPTQEAEREFTPREYTDGRDGLEDARTWRDYVVILRERKWWVVIAFLVVFLATLVFTLSRTKLYTAVASIEILPREAVVMKVQEVRDSDLRGPEDLNTQIKILESMAIVQKVAEHLAPEDIRTLMTPYASGGAGDPLVPEEVLARNRRIYPVRQTRLLQVAYSHPDGQLAARVANLFVEEFMHYNTRWRVDESMKAVEDLKIRADQQGKKVQELSNNLQTYKERQSMISLDQRKDIITERLKAMNGLLTQADSRLREADLRWTQVQACRAAKGNLANLTFIASVPLIQNLLQQVATQTVTVSELRQRYRAQHPKMREAVQSLAQTQDELARALDNAAASIRNEYETSLQAVAHAKTDLTNQETEALKMGRLSIDYEALHNELMVNEQLLENIVTRMRETSMSASIESYNARIVDRAQRPLEYSSPNLVLNLGLGAVIGLALGLSLAIFTGVNDDRVKSSHQIESVIGLPLIGIIPVIPKMDRRESSQIVLSRAAPLAAEAFLTLHSNLRLRNGADRMQVIIVTSTTPSEGKSFVSSNLALTFAAHGERTIIVDCDLRKPILHRSFGVPNAKGVIDYCTKGTALDELIVRNHRVHFDILPAGGRAATPTHILNHENFARMISELRQRYDRIFIDTPPLAPVSDAMIILPRVDGSLFTVRFNQVRTKAAEFAARRLLESGVPCLGAVLNGLDLAVSDHYYAGYYDKSYQDYVIYDKPVVPTPS